MIGLVVLFGVLTVSLTGCLRLHAALAVSQDDLISGEIVVAALPSGPEDKGPELTIRPELTDRVSTEPYSADGYVGQKVTFDNLRFADFSLLTETISTAKQYRMSFRRSGGLVSLAGSIDLTRVPADRADVQVKIALPGGVSRTNGDNTDGTITWTPKPGAVTEFSATTQYSGEEGLSWAQWVAAVGGGAVVVALLVVLLALFTHRRTLRAERLQAAAARR
ncbi:hypothetical protein BLA60_21740 [Actinophytocola xinjiangensis]|uniref:LppM domain-containing protein n=1 Tax=Actinophytocola xinjiangensis TaxID=485602 RepID=A0A7Z1AX32_9PSEU|nr:DUF3153 domain-containing protein [Actinophytocola xinjiangensis]OLF08652.1 hypothetical protein BLA60_21740 [Actinophytocola xinjiangensis]